MKAACRIIVVAVVAVAMLPAALATGHPGGHGEGAQTGLAASEGGGGSSALLIAAVSLGLVGLALGLGSLKYLQTQNARAKPPAEPGPDSATGPTGTGAPPLQA